MKNDEILQNSINEAKKPDRRKPSWVRWAAAAACAAVIVGCSGCSGDKDRPPAELLVAENLWKKENFGAYSLSYNTASVSPLSAGSGNKVVLLSDQDTSIQTQNITITQDQTFKFETLIAQRYAVYRTEAGLPIFYDTVENQEVNLQERILGDTSHILKRVEELIDAIARENYADFIASEVNRQALDLYLTYHANGTLSEKQEEFNSMTLDTAFMDSMPEYESQTEEYKQYHCRSMIYRIFGNAMVSLQDEEPDLYYTPYSLTILGMDRSNGLCIVRGNAFAGDGALYAVYDIRSDNLQKLSDFQGSSFIGVMMNKGYTFRFSADGSIATVAWPKCDFWGTTYPRADNYRGENLGAFFLKNGTAHSFEGGWYDATAIASSELYISQRNNVLYYKKMDEALTGRGFYFSEEIWPNRLTLFNRDTDFWVFCPLNEHYSVEHQVTLQGNFVRFAANETAVIMERNGSYYAYALEDGRDITQSMAEGTVSMYLHEQMKVVLEERTLYAINIFTGERKPLGTADDYILTDDGAFVFAYCQGDRHVTCYNVASGEYCQIQIDAALCDQLFSQENVVLQMSYNQNENTFLISYYVQQDVPEQKVVDFYGLLAQLKPNSTPEDPSNPRVITDFTVSENVMEQFRKSAYRFDNPTGINYWYSYYPEFMTMYEDRYSIFQCLDLTEPEDYLDVKGTRFVLYDNADEELALVFWEDWLLYDYEDLYSGFHIEYTVNGRTYNYQFLLESAQ